MIPGFAAAITWALDTVIISVALGQPVFAATAEAAALAVFTSTFLHDASSSLCAFGYMAIRRKLGAAWRVLRSRDGLVIIGAAIIGSPVGMTGYVLAINNIGPSYTAAISSFFPAFAALLSRVFLKEKMHWYQYAGLIVCIIAVVVLGWTPVESVPGNWTVGIIGALVCVFGWGTEAVVINWGLKNSDADNEVCMIMRQTTSALVYALIILPIVGGWESALQIVQSSAMPIIFIAAFIGMLSYVVYYKAIDILGAAPAAAINITYSAWAIPISMALTSEQPTLRGVICALFIIAGAIAAATKVDDLCGKKSTGC